MPVLPTIGLVARRIPVAHVGPAVSFPWQSMIDLAPVNSQVTVRSNARTSPSDDSVTQRSGEQALRPTMVDQLTVAVVQHPAHPPAQGGEQHVRRRQGRAVGELAEPPPGGRRPVLGPSDLPVLVEEVLLDAIELGPPLRIAQRIQPRTQPPVAGRPVFTG